MNRLRLINKALNILKLDHNAIINNMRKGWGTDTVFRGHLHNTGIEFVGSGLYSVVLAHPKFPGRVFKVSTSVMDGFRAFAKYCQENPEVPMLPTIHSINEVGDFVWYEMDRLYPIINTEDWYGESYLSEHLENVFDLIELAYFSLGSAERQLYMDVHPVPYDIRLAVLKNAKAVLSRFNQTFHIDLHNENVMQDAEGNIFITDPIGCSVRVDKKELV